MFILVLTNIKSGHAQKIIRGLIQRGHRVEVVSYEKMEIPGIKVHTIGLRFFHRYVWYILSGLMLRILIRRLCPDIVFAVYLTGYGLMGTIANFHPLVVMAIGSDVLISMNRSYLMRIITKKILRETDGFITVADHIADRLIQRGVNPERIITCPIGIDTSTFNLPQSLPCKEQGIIVSTRLLEPLYNIEQLIESCPLLLKRHSNAKVIIVGDGKQREYLKYKVRVSGCEEKVSFVGRVAFESLVNILKRSQIYVSMSTSDGASVSLFEAMACGCFPIVSDIIANRNWIRNGINGFIVPIGRPELLAERISEVLESPELVKKAQLENWKIVKENLDINYTIERIEKYLSSF